LRCEAETRGSDGRSGSLFSYVDFEDRVAARLSAAFDPPDAAFNAEALGRVFHPDYAKPALKRFPADLNGDSQG